MSHSFYEVLPYILEKIHHGNEIILNYDLLEEVINDDEKEGDIEESFYKLTNDYHGHTVTFALPSFTGRHFETGEERTFEAKTFSIYIENTIKSLDDCYEGKTWYSYAIHLVDENSGEKMYAWANQYVAIDRSLTDFGIQLEESKIVEEQEKANTVFAIVENVWPEGYLMHGIFSSLEHAVKGYAQLKEHGNTLLSGKKVTIEEVPMGKPLFYKDQTDVSLRSVVAVYNIEGKIIEKFD